MNSLAWLRWIERGFCFIGLVLIGLWLANLGETYAFQIEESERLDGARANSEPDGVAAASAADPAPALLGRIEIPRLRISAMVAEGIDPSVLERAVGHVPTTSRPGEPGNVALAGHRDTFFHGLGRVRPNDIVRIVTRGRTYSYRVNWGSVVGPRRTDLLDSTSTSSLTLVTCYPFEMIGRAPQRFVVRATQVDPATLAGEVVEAASSAPAVRILRALVDRREAANYVASFIHGGH